MESGVALDGFGSSRSAWSRKTWRGSLSCTSAGVPGGLQGIVQHSGGMAKDLAPAKFATDLDVAVSFAQTPLALGLATATAASVYFAITAQTIGETVYRCQFRLNPTNGYAYVTVPSGGFVHGQILQDGNNFLIQAGGFAALVWNVLMGVGNGAVGFQVGGLVVASIAHGVEIGGGAP